MFKILCVCSGNTCRSPMVAALLEQKAARRSLPLSVSSAGLAAFPGDAASENAVRVMAELDADLSAHRSAALTTDLLFDADAVFCMNAMQKAVLSRYLPAETIFCPQPEIPDPYGGDISVYRACRDALDAATDAFLKKLETPRITPMTQANLASVAEIERQCFSTPWSADALRAELSNDTARFFVLTVFGEAVGYVGLHLVCSEGYLANLAVLPAKRRKGYGRRLMQAAIECCEKEHAQFLSLEVRKSNAAAQALYRSLGFTPRGVRKHFYSQPQEDAVIMTLDFEPKGGDAGAGPGD
ncbi:MAG: ribosomal protein S18-alanine N-acetyltransferase [Clostridia bacterium]|nr:ribosomal protein S18-alanine N-acetyltransferase [Clostridia bacterium]